MVERKEVEALLASCERIRDKNLDPMKFSPIVPAPTLAALCRAWLAVQDAPVGVVDLRTGWDDGSGSVEVHYEEGKPDIPLKQRVRIVKEGE